MPKFDSATSSFRSHASDPSNLPDFDTKFIGQADIEAFAKALNAPENSPVIALNDWRPIHQRVRPRGARARKKKPKRSKDETGEGFVYNILKWPLLLLVLSWITVLAISYLATRLYVYGYEHFLTWRGRRHELRRSLQLKINYEDWKSAAKELDKHLGNEQWKETDDYAFYDYTTVRKVKDQLETARARANLNEQAHIDSKKESVDQLRRLVEDCVKNNFVGVENPRLYGETYYGTKNLVQDFTDELHTSLAFILRSTQLSQADKYAFAKHLHTNFGRTALCLSGGASFAWYHFGVAKALLDASLLPDVITGTSGGALVAALISTRTNEELHKLLVPALAYHMQACDEPLRTWVSRWWRTGARFDSLKWARHASWFCRGSTTFREAYERTGRILNVSCVPSDPYSPTILANYLTAPDCVIWSAVLASAAVPGILNPVVLMIKMRDGTLTPWSFGNKWKDGSLRTDIPLKALNLHFNVNFSLVSQVNPHINLFFFSARGSVGRPTRHRNGKGWRGGYIGSALETYLKLDLQKFIKVLRHLELLPRPLGQDWSVIWLQQFSGTITIWPKSRISDFYYILSDPTFERLARMIQAGQQSTFPKLLFLANRMKIEHLIEEGLLLGRQGEQNPDGGIGRDGRSFHLHPQEMRNSADDSTTNGRPLMKDENRRSSVIQEIKRQSGVFFDDYDDHDGGGTDTSAVDDEMTD